MSDELPKIAGGESADQASGTNEAGFPVGVEDGVVLPLVLAALIVRKTLRAVLSMLIHILDFAFPVAMQLAKVPLFIARVLGDGVIAILQGVVGYLPVSETSRARWRAVIVAKWSWLRQKISYTAFEHAVHRMFEGGMAWVFRKCRALSPHAALLVIAGAVLWLPISFGTATAIHAVLLAKAASLPAWMQLLHPLATCLAKSKLLVLPVYPAAWPQAKKHPLIRAIAGFYRELKDLSLVRRTAYRYGQMERATRKIVDLSGRVASIVGLRYLLNILSGLLNGAATQSSEEKPSERMRKFFGRWSLKFSAEYYEAKERKEAAMGRQPA